MAHDLKNMSTERLEARLLDLAEFGKYGVGCECDDIEVDDGYMVRDCDWNTEDAITAELVRRDIETAR